MIKKKTVKKFPVTITQAFIALLFMLIIMLASLIYLHQSANESVDESLATEQFKQQLMINQLQECINSGTTPCEFELPQIDN